MLVNPLHASEPVPPIQPSPYLPSSRRFANPLSLRLERIPEYAVPARLSEKRSTRSGRLLDEIAGSTRSTVIDHGNAKREALEIIFRCLVRAGTGSVVCCISAP